MAVVPIIGKGTAVDPRRPMYAPLPGQIAPSSRKGILAYTFVESDDGKFALAEFVAADPAEFHDILADANIKKFLKGSDKLGDVEAEFKKHKKDFDLNKFGVRMQ